MKLRIPAQRQLVRVAILALLMFSATELGRLFATFGIFVSPLWPAGGVSVAALTLVGLGLWPALLIGPICSSLVHGLPLFDALVLGAGDTLNSVLAAALLRRVGFHPGFRRVRDALAWFGFAAVAGPLLGSTVGVWFLTVTRVPSPGFASLFRTWFLGDAIGVLVVGGAAVAFYGAQQRLQGASRRVEAAVLALLIASTATVAFGIVHATTRPLPFLLFPLLVWVALRFGPRGTALAALVVSFAAVWGILTSGVDREGQLSAIAGMQGFLLVFAFSGLTLSAALEEKQQATDEARRLNSAMRDAERDLRLRERLLHAITDTAPVGLYVVDLRSNEVLFFNQRFCELWGVELAPLKAQLGALTDSRVVELCSARLRDPGAIGAQPESPLEEDRSADERELAFADGRTIRQFTTRIRDDAGRDFARVYLFEEVTARKIALEELTASRERYRALVSGSPDAILRLSGAGVLLDAIVPSGAERHWPKVGEALGRHAAQVLPDLAAPVLAAAARALSQKKAQPAPAGVEHFECRLPNGRDLDVRLAASGRDEVIATLRDVTEHKQLQTKLQLADRMASLGTLAAGIAHEINNPLSFVIANQTLLDEHLAALEQGAPAASQARELLRDAVEGTARVRNVVRDLKLFARHDDAEAAPIDLNRVVERAVSMAGNSLRHRAQVVKELAELPLVQGNESRLGQVFLNLVVNAAQAIPEGRSEGNFVHVSTRLEGTKAVVEVRDTGSGIAPEHLQHIFDPFFTTKPVGEGTGLGLAICHEIITAHGGQIGVRSAPGEGTTFRVSLPVGPVREGAPQKPPERVRAGSRKRVLVVDDEVLLTRTLSRALADEHEVTPVNSGAEALAQLAAGKRFDVILCDLMMPGMTGMELHQKIGEQWPGHEHRMVFLTGGAFTASARDFLARVPNERLDKPFDVAALKRMLRERPAPQAG